MSAAARAGVSRAALVEGRIAKINPHSEKNLYTKHIKEENYIQIQLYQDYQMVCL